MSLLIIHFRLEKLAHANHNRVLLEAEAEAEAIRLKGDAEAFALEAKGKAEAEQLARKADAYRLYEEAAIVEMMLEVLPKVSSYMSAAGLVNNSWPLTKNKFFSDCFKSSSTTVFNRHNQNGQYRWRHWNK